MGSVVAVEDGKPIVQFGKCRTKCDTHSYAILPDVFSVYRYTGPEKKGGVDAIRPGDLGVVMNDGKDELHVWGHEATWDLSSLSEIQKLVIPHFAACPQGHRFEPVLVPPEKRWCCSSGQYCQLFQRGEAQAICRFRCSKCNLDQCNRCYEAMALPGLDSQRLEVFCLDPILWTDPNRAKASPDKAEASGAGSSSKEAKAEAAQASPDKAEASGAGHLRIAEGAGDTIPTGEGTRVAMFSARFDGGPIEQKIRRVFQILCDRKYDILMVAADAGESFGDLTTKYLGRLHKENGTMIAVCTKDYGEMTASAYSSHKELKFALDYEEFVTVLPLRVDDTYPPKPPGGPDHKDKEYLAQGYILSVFKPSVVFLECRGKSEMEIAAQIANALQRHKVAKDGSS